MASKFATVDMTGKTFGTITVLKFDAEGRTGPRRWICRCICGKVWSVNGMTLRRKVRPVRNCGCQHPRGVNHGMTKTPEYRLWKAMKSRCLLPENPRYKSYGGRGITVADEWVSDFLSFLNHVGRRPSPEYSLDRINNDDGYVPGNVRWATRAQQQRNRRDSVYIMLKEGPVHFHDVRDALGIPISTLRHRVKLGLTEETGLLSHDVKPRGEDCSFAKLRATDVHAIRQMLKRGEKQRDIAAKFGVSQALIYRINVGKAWSALHSQGEAK